MAQISGPFLHPQGSLCCPGTLAGAITSAANLRFSSARCLTVTICFSITQCRKSRYRNIPMSPDSFLVITAPDFKSEKQIALQLSNIEFPFHLSSSGRYLAYVEDRLTPNYRNERHLWGLDLESGAKKEFLATPPPGLPTSPEPNVVFTVLGWTANNSDLE